MGLNDNTTNHKNGTWWGINVADYKLWFNASEAYIRALAPPRSSPFFVNSKAGNIQAPAFSHQLTLDIFQEKIGRHCKWNKRVYGNEIWELWQNDDNDMVFYNPIQPVLRKLIVKPDFRIGQVFGDFLENYHGLIIPKELEIVLYVNWLGLFGDLILHAVGVSIDHEGYVFVGNSGAGKSTLASLVARQDNVAVLGEDQVILRLINDEFWIFGTPWHFQSSLCSAEGARLKGVYFLEGRGKHSVRDIRQLEGVSKLMQTAFVPYYNEPAVGRILTSLVRLSDKIPYLSFSFGKDEKAPDLINRFLL